MKVQDSWFCHVAPKFLIKFIYSSCYSSFLPHSHTTLLPITWFQSAYLLFLLYAFTWVLSSTVIPQFFSLLSLASFFNHSLTDGGLVVTVNFSSISNKQYFVLTNLRSTGKMNHVCLDPATFQCCTK